MSLVISILWKENISISLSLVQLSSRKRMYIYIYIYIHIYPCKSCPFGEVCETVRQQKDSLLGEKTGLPNAAVLEILTPPTLSMTW
jgi:hypothetical protein